MLVYNQCMIPFARVNFGSNYRESQFRWGHWIVKTKEERSQVYVQWPYVMLGVAKVVSESIKPKWHSNIVGGINHPTSCDHSNIVQVMQRSEALHLLGNSPNTYNYQWFITCLQFTNITNVWIIRQIKKSYKFWKAKKIVVIIIIIIMIYYLYCYYYY